MLNLDLTGEGLLVRAAHLDALDASNLQDDRTKWVYTIWLAKNSMANNWLHDVTWPLTSWLLKLTRTQTAWWAGFGLTEFSAVWAYTPM